MKHIKMFRAALAALVTVVLTSQAKAIDIFVSPTGSGEKTGMNWSNALNGSNDGWHIDVKNAITAAVASEAKEVNVYLAVGDYTVTNQLVLSSITVPLKFSGGYVGAADGSMEKSTELKTTLKRNTSYYSRFLNAASLIDFSIEEVSFNGGYLRDNGGALYLSSTFATIINCVFTGNTLGKGSGNNYFGVKGAGVYSQNGTVQFKNCQFLSNSIAGGYNMQYGAGLYTLNTDVTIDGCVFNGNNCYAMQAGGLGGAANINGKNVIIKNTRFENNRTRSTSNTGTGKPTGGAIAIRSATRVEITDCEFINNFTQVNNKTKTSRANAAYYFDDFNKSDGVMTAAVTRCVFDSTLVTQSTFSMSDILLNYGHLYMTNCVIMGAKGSHANMAYSIRAEKVTPVATDPVSGKDAAQISDCSLNLVNCTVADGVEYGVGAIGDDVTVDLKNCIVSGHSLTGVVNAALIEYSYIQTNDDGSWDYAGAGNLNPNVVGDINWTGAPYYHLLTKNSNGAITNGWFSGTFESAKTAADSPCIDAGAPGSVGLDLEPYYSGRRVNIGAYGGTPWASKTSPLQGFKLIIR